MTEDVDLTPLYFIVERYYDAGKFIDLIDIIIAFRDELISEEKETEK